MNTQTRKPPVKSQNQDTLIEQLRDIGRGVTKSVTQDVVGGMASDALSSLFGTKPTANSGEIKPNQTVDVQSQHQPEPPPVPEFPFFPRFRRPERSTPAFNQETINKLREQELLVAKKIDEIRQELKALVLAIKNVDQSLVKTVNEEIIDPGLYHLNFLDRLKIILRLARQNLNDSVSWLNVMKSRKKQKRYWAMYKKKGTEFGLNPDRVVSTQVG